MIALIGALGVLTLGILASGAVVFLVSWVIEISDRWFQKWMSR